MEKLSVYLAGPITAVSKATGPQVHGNFSCQPSRFLRGGQPGDRHRASSPGTISATRVCPARDRPQHPCHRRTAAARRGLCRGVGRNPRGGGHYFQCPRCVPGCASRSRAARAGRARASRSSRS